MMKGMGVCAWLILCGKFIGVSHQISFHWFKLNHIIPLNYKKSWKTV